MEFWGLAATGLNPPLLIFKAFETLLLKALPLLLFQSICAQVFLSDWDFWSPGTVSIVSYSVL